jgi:hypothetical protein
MLRCGSKSTLWSPLQSTAWPPNRLGRCFGLFVVRYALYAQDIEIYVAPTWDSGERWIATMRHIAKEAGCWVIGTATAMQGADVLDDFPGRNVLFKPEEWINDGDAVVIKPMGAIAAGSQSTEARPLCRNRQGSRPSAPPIA